MKALLMVDEKADRKAAHWVAVKEKTRAVQ